MWDFLLLFEIVRFGQRWLRRRRKTAKNEITEQDIAKFGPAYQAQIKAALGEDAPTTEPVKPTPAPERIQVMPPRPHEPGFLYRRTIGRFTMTQAEPEPTPPAKLWELKERKRDGH